MANKNQALDDDNCETYFSSLSKDDVLRHLTIIAFELNAAIDNGIHQDLTTERIITEINNGTIFNVLAMFPQLEKLACGSVYAELRAWLLSEWQSTQNATVPEDFRTTHNGSCLLLAYVIYSIQLRTLGDEPWPTPGP